MSINSGAHCSSTYRELGEILFNVFKPADSMAYHTCIAAKLLAKPDRCCILEMGPPNFYDLIKLSCFPGQSFFKIFKGWDKFFLN